MRALFAWIRRRWRLTAIVILAVTLVPLIVLDLLLAPLIGGKLLGQIRQRLNADVTVGYFLYHFPYGLTAHHCHWQLPSSFGSSQSIDAWEVAVTLDHLPLGPGPVIVSELTITQPIVHLSSGSGGGGQSTTVPSGEPRKLSDILRLNHLLVKDGQFIFHDGSESALDWAGIDIDIASSPRGAADYDFKLIARNGQTADLTGAGVFDVDRRIASFDQFAVTIRCDDQRPEQLPQALQKIWSRYRIRGQLRIDGSAKGSLVNPLKNSFQCTFTLPNASAYSPEIDTTLDDVSLSIHATSDGNKLDGDVANFSARSGDALLTTTPGLNFALDSATHTWSIDSIFGKVSSAVATTRPSTDSRPLFRQAQTSGQITFWGNAAKSAATRPADCKIVFSASDAAMRLARPRLDLSKIALSAELRADRLDLNYFQCRGFGGQISSRGTISSSPPYVYAFNLGTHDANLPDIAAIFDPQKSAGQAQGRVRLEGVFQGQLADRSTSAKQLHGRGRFAISKGNLWNIYALQRIERQVPVASSALTAGQAAAHFKVDDRRVELTDATISAPVLGLEGSGIVNDDGTLDLRVIALPLADWKRQLDQAKIPIVGQALGLVAGGVQSVINSVTRNLLYEFHVTGKASDPKVETIPSPGVSKSALEIFRKMLNQSDANAPAELPDDDEGN